ncbi:MAG TPA: class I SAM-dependent methyltransferase [Candidatus Acidoferrales bacterium]|nr:class I SAM-dependent methyltransferase [Candidatus Acidoferrales bacterium]
MAVSVAMLGTTAGAVATNLWFRSQGSGRGERVAVRIALAYAVSLVACTALLLRFNPVFSTELHDLFVLSGTFVTIGVPFFLSGIVICLVLLGRGEGRASVYAADLIGAGVGCVLFVPLMSVADGPRLSLWLGVLAAAGAFAMARAIDATRLQWTAFATGLLLTSAAFLHLDRHALQVHFAKGVWDRDHDFEKWNAFSRLTVDDYISIPFGWGIPSNVDRMRRSVEQKGLMIDGTAFTVLTRFDGDASKLQHLEWDVTALPYALGSRGAVLVAGVGGGRDILTALYFGHSRVVGVEVNRGILDLLRRDFAEFSGHLDRRPDVELVHDEARSYAARSVERFDVVQASLVDTWAAAASGAYALSENSLYTTEAFARFLDRLTPRGVLAVSRWYYDANPGETLRLVSLAATALRQRGVANPRERLFLARGGGKPFSVATLLVAAAALEPGEIGRLRDWCAQHSFDTVLAPDEAEDASWARLAGSVQPTEFLESFPLDLSAPTDDRPFFFNTLRTRDMFRRDRPRDAITANGDAVAVLGWLLALVVLLSSLLILIPLILRLRGTSLPFRVFEKLGFFGTLGVGFILIEIALMQRLMIALGHPTFALAVVLSSLLVSAGLGSLWVQRMGEERLDPGFVRKLLLVLMVVALATGLGGAPVARSIESSPTWLRVATAVFTLAPLGFMLGMPLVSGLAVSSNDAREHQALYWGVNGAASVCGSVLATGIALLFGISCAYWSGMASYAVAALISYRAWPD